LAYTNLATLQALLGQACPRNRANPLEPDPAKSNRVMAAMLQMGKIEIEPLRRAFEGSEQPSPSRA
jgi:hypothetical protein